MAMKLPPPAKKAEVSLVRSSAAEYLTFVAASQDNKAFLHAHFGLGDDFDHFWPEAGLAGVE